MKLKKLLKTFKGLNDTKYELYVVDKHYIEPISKEYYKYKVFELFTKREDPKTIFISVYKDKNKLLKYLYKENRIYSLPLNLLAFVKEQEMNRND